jgi:FG-GAP repeat
MRRSTVWIALVGGWLPLVALLGPRTADAGVTEPWEVGQVDRPGQFTIYNRTMTGAQIGFPLAAGDMNGDGRADLILTPMNADSGPNTNRISAGEATIVLSAGGIAGQRNLAELDLPALPSDVTLVFGADNFDYLGTQVDAADLDGDGYADAIIGAQYGDGSGNGRAESGEIVIVWGGPAIGGRTIDLAAPPDAAVTFVYGANPGDRLGAWVSSGDVDGDGIEDAILGADEANPDGNHHHAGITYVLYGSAALRSLDAIDLANPGVPVTAINGIDQEDHSGATVRAADLNRDGAAEVLIGAGLNRLSAAIGPNGSFNGHGSGGGDGPNNEGCGPASFDCNVGEAYIVYGQRGVRPQSIDLGSPPASTTIIYGVDAFDAYGEELFPGDFNGDGWGDVAIGAITGDGPGNSRPAAGELALILGGPGLAGSVIDLTAPPPNTTFFYGRRGGAIAGDTLMMLDVDGDGRDELVIASPNDNPGRVEAGTNFVFFGTPEPLPSTIDLAAIPAELSHLVINGADSRDMLAYSMGRGDVNGDGLVDMVLNVMGGDGFDNQLVDAGDAYVLDSVAVTNAAGREVVPTRTPTETMIATPTPTPTETPVETSSATLTVTPTSTPLPMACAGDCDGGGAVTTDELITAVRIALGELSASTCSAVDADASGTVAIGELIAAVSHSLSGC